AVGGDPPPGAADLWERQAAELQATVGPGEPSLPEVREQEDRFVRLLEESAAALWPHEPRLAWARVALLRLIERRKRRPARGLDLHTAQVLANTPHGRCGVGYAVPPWLVISATLDPRANGAVRPVDALADKLALLREEGVRVVGVADTPAQLAEARRAAGPGV